MKFLVYPVGYDPLVVLDDEGWACKPGAHTHSPEVEKQRQLVKLAKVVDTRPPAGRWYQEIEE